MNHLRDVFRIPYFASLSRSKFGLILSKHLEISKRQAAEILPHSYFHKGPQRPCEDLFGSNGHEDKQTGHQRLHGCPLRNSKVGFLQVVLGFLLKKRLLIWVYNQRYNLYQNPHHS